MHSSDESEACVPALPSSIESPHSAPSKRDQRVLSSDSESVSSHPSSSNSNTTSCSTRSSLSQLSQLTPGDYEKYLAFEPPVSVRAEVRGRQSYARAQEMFAPIANHMYKRMVTNFASIGDEVDGILRLPDCIYHILQIIPDLLGVAFRIEEYSSQDYDVDIGPIFERAARLNVNIQNCDVIFNHRNDYAKRLSNTIDAFLWTLCKKLTSDMQHFSIVGKVFRVFISFLRHLGDSAVEALRLTAFTFAFRISKFLSIRKIQIALVESKQNFDRASLLINKIDDILRVNNIDAIYKRVDDKKFSSFDLEFVKDISICMISNDTIFANDKNLLYINDLLMARDRSVVVHGINTCLIFVRDEQLHHVLEMDSFKLIVQNIYENLCSEFDDASIIAARFFAYAFSKKHNIATPDIIRRLVMRMFSPNLKIGRACGEAISQYLAPLDHITIYRRLIAYANEHDRKTHCLMQGMPYLVESMHPHLHLVHHGMILITLMKPTRFNRDEFENMMAMLYASCCMHIKGAPDYINRTRPQQKKLNESRVNCSFEVAHSILESYPGILREHYNNDSIKWVFKSLTLIDFSHPQMFQLRNLIGDLLETGLCYFDSEDIDHFDMWKSVAALIKIVAKMTCGDTFSNLLETKLAESVCKYNRNLELFKSSDGADPQQILEIKLKVVCELKKILTILEVAQPLDPNVKLVLFYDAGNTSKLTNEIITGQVMCSAWIFKRFVLGILEAGNEQLEMNAEFVQQLRLDAMTFWKALDDLFLANADLQQTVFEAMGIFMTSYKTLFSPQCLTRHPMLKSARLNHFTEWKSMPQIFDFFYESCIHEVHDMLPYPLRRWYVQMFFGLFVFALKDNKFAVDEIVTLLRYSCQCSKIYGEYKTFVNVIVKNNEPDDRFYFRFIIRILKQIPETNIELIGMFVDITPKDKCLSFLRFAIAHVGSLHDFELLHKLRAFLQDLNQTDKEDIYELVRDFPNAEPEVINFKENLQ